MPSCSALRTRPGAISSELKAYTDGLGGLWFQGKAERQGWLGVRVDVVAARRQRIDVAVDLSHHGPSRPDHRADRLCLMPSCSRPGRHMAPPMSRTVTPTKPDEDHLAVARFQGRRVTGVARALHGEREAVPA
ncbi:hypothetical protein ACTMU2_26860 [Cupriavidus basilensis]